MDTAAALWRLARPRGALWVTLLPILGYGWAHWDRSMAARSPAALPWLALAWVLLHAGTLWLNAALDRDEGEVLWGAGAEAVPPGASAAGYLALAGAVAAGWVAHPVVGLCAAGCAALAVLYSHPRVALKAHPLGGPAVNALGYGVLSPLAGWWLVGVSPGARTWASWALLVSFVLGAYFLAQAFQEAEDRARGYRTLVATHGPRVVVGAARLGFAITAVGVAALAIVGWYPRLTLLAIPVWWRADLWLAAATRGARDPGAGATAARVPDAKWTGEGFLRLLAFGWVLLALVLGQHLWEVRGVGPTAGLATAGGWPADRAWVREIRLARQRAEAAR